MSCIINQEIQKFYWPTHSSKSADVSSKHCAALTPCSGFSTSASTATSIPLQLQMCLSSVGADQVYCNYSTPLNLGFMGSTNINRATIEHQKRFCTPPSALITDYGLLQDIVPSTVRIEE
ncbi:unnamed protein product [Fraxinus pennsylvanica]|uniref:Uncharacterized protein n=1 Tax=Fraxinus pennsylvanica TaxID=56036 RepID=A0AAD2E7D1_9LAMI|nr:unnamed protein product [Fraxinus pennsylvanica]